MSEENEKTNAELERILMKRRRRLGGRMVEVSHRELYNEIFGKSSRLSEADGSSLILSKYQQQAAFSAADASTHVQDDDYKPSFLKSMGASASIRLDFSNVLNSTGEAARTAVSISRSDVGSVFNPQIMRSLFSDNPQMSNAASVCLSDKDKDKRVIEVIKNYL